MRRINDLLKSFIRLLLGDSAMNVTKSRQNDSLLAELVNQEKNQIKKHFSVLLMLKYRIIIHVEQNVSRSNGVSPQILGYPTQVARGDKLTRGDSP